MCLKPQTFMNNSGISVQAFCGYYKISPSTVMVVCDDISIPFGSFKISTIPGTAGHNGIKSIAAHIGGDFSRYRMGLGTKPPFMKLDDYVLSRFSEDERARLPNIATVFEKNIKSIVDKGIEKALNTINTCA
jgi:PTH1 family peptidyl-tRNA hydrolase